jgi:hypothetical protein
VEQLGAYRNADTSWFPAVCGPNSTLCGAGDPIYFEDAPFSMARLEGGGTENVWFNTSLSALRDEDGSMAAVFDIRSMIEAGKRL